MGQVMQLASFSLAEVQYITGDIRYIFSSFFFLLLRFTIYTQNKNKKSADEINFFFFFQSYQIQESSKSAQLRVRAKQENVSGVMLPVFEMYNEGGNGKREI